MVNLLIKGGNLSSGMWDIYILATPRLAKDLTPFG